MVQQEMGVSLLQHLHEQLSFKTILINIIPDVETPPKLNSGADMATESPSNQ
jgi:hypothetical protein